MRSRISLLLFTAIALQLAVSSATLAQEIANYGLSYTVDPPAVAPRTNFCVSVMCQGSNSFTTVKGTSEADMWDRVNQKCPNGYVVDPQPVPNITCLMIDVWTPDGGGDNDFQMNIMRFNVSPPWKIHAYLCYCDGSPGRDLPVSGATYCEAVQKARTALCEMKDPCKAAYLKFCVVKSPCSQNKCCIRR